MDQCHKQGNIFIVQDWQAVEFGLPYATIDVAAEGNVASAIADYGPYARVLAVHHVPDTSKAMHSITAHFSTRFKPLKQQANTFEAYSIAELVRYFYQLVHYAS